MKTFYVIKERATGITMIISECLQEIKEIYKDFNKEYFVLEDNFGKEVLL